MNPASIAAHTANALQEVFHHEYIPSLAYKDAIFFSGHKFIGGPGTFCSHGT